jgi:hypothetical protein
LPAIPERISDAITGHKTPGIGRKYEHVPMSKKFDAISKLPVIPLHPSAISDRGTNPIASKITIARAPRSDQMRVTHRAHLVEQDYGFPGCYSPWSFSPGFAHHRNPS